MRLLASTGHGDEPSAAIGELELLGAKCQGDPDEPPPRAYEPASVAPFLNGVFPAIDPLLGGQVPPLLSQTGAFSQFQPLIASPALMPYEVNQPLWSDGASKRRWVALANDRAFATQQRLTFDPLAPWGFPAGTVFVKHFELATSEEQPELTVKLETSSWWSPTTACRV